MVRKYTDLERGESASKTGRDHIPPRVYKEAAHLNREFDAIRQTAAQITPFNVKGKTAELTKLLDQFAPKYETYLTECKSTTPRSSGCGRRTRGLRRRRRQTSRRA